MKANKHLIPVVLFAYNRPDQLVKTLEGLKTNHIPLLYIFSDGPKTTEDQAAIQDVRSIIDAIHWTKVVKTYNKNNVGLKKSIIVGLNKVFRNHDKAIVVEDDIYVAPNFYNYMSVCLNKYQDNLDIAGITGLRYPFSKTHLKDDQFDVFLCPRISSWGWGTWKRVWQSIDFDTESLAKKIADRKPNLARGGVDIPEAINQLVSGRLTTSWAVPFFINMAIDETFFIWPKKNMVVNTGLVTGTHANEENEPSWKLKWENLSSKKTWQLPNKPTLNIALMNDFYAFFEPENLYKASLRKNVKRKIKLLNQKYTELKTPVYFANARFKQYKRGIRGRLSAFTRFGNNKSIHPNSHMIVRQPQFRIVNYSTVQRSKKSKHALLSYLTQPVVDELQGVATNKFSNDGIARAWPKVLNKLGYTVDIINWDDTKFVPDKDYDLLVCHGAINFDALYKHKASFKKIIYFSTGSYWQFHNKQEKHRFDYFKKRHGRTLPLDRYIEKAEEKANAVADGIICLGNKDVAETYNKFSKVINLPIGCFKDPLVGKKDLEAGRYNFLFFSGAGNIHKGLDLLLDVFSQTPRCHLYISTFLDREFGKYYKKILELPNIHFVDFTELRSDKYYELTSKCNYIIFPSCSEGSPGSVVECMQQGLIPLVTQESHLDVRNAGIVLKNERIGAIKKAVDDVISMPRYELKKRSELARKIVNDNHDPELFRRRLSKAVESITKV